MKILVSWLRDFVDVTASPEEIASTMSVRGFAVESLDPTGDGDAVIDFEVTANRPDCMSVAGMAREIATAFGLPTRRPVVKGREADETASALRLASLWQEFQQAGIALRRLADLMDAPAELYSLRPSRGYDAAGRVELDRVTFRYREDLPPVLENFSLVLEQIGRAHV